MIWEMNPQLWRALLVVAVLAACTMAFLPNPLRPPDEPPGTYLYALAMADLSGLSQISIPESSSWGMVVGLYALGFVVECVKAMPVLKRDASAFDLAMDAPASEGLLIAHLPFFKSALEVETSREGTPWR